MGLDPARDFLRFDGLVPVTLRWLNDDGSTEDSVEIAKALPRATTSVIQVGDRLIAPENSLTWHMLKSAVGAREPVKGCVVIEGAVRWVVLKVELQTLRTRWKLTCVRE